MEFSPIVNDLVWTLVHSLWQGLVAAAFAALVISITRRSTARLRYNLLGAIMLLFLGAVVLTFSIQVNGHTSGLQPNDVTEFETAGAITTVSSPGFRTTLIDWVDTNASLLGLAWMFFFAFNCIRLSAGIVSARRMRHHKVFPVLEEWKDRLEALKTQLKMSQPVQIMQSGLVKVPVALGFFKPVILLPIGLLAHLPADQVETIIIHELGHIRRKDFLVNLLQRIAESIFFFNPSLLWISSLIRDEREACCDDIVISNTSQQKKYLEALVTFQEYSTRQKAFAMAISHHKYHLLNRMQRIITKKNKRLNLFETAMLFGGFILFSAFGLFRNYGAETVDKPAKLRTELPVQTELLEPAPVIILAKIKQKPTPPRSAGKAVNNTVVVKRDTIPAKKITAVSPVTPDNNESQSWKEDELRLKSRLFEIQKIKDAIGADKEVIGEKKKLLETADHRDHKRINDEIEAKRAAIIKKRQQLDLLRVDVVKDKKIIDNKKEKSRELKKETQKEKQQDTETHDE